MACGDLQMRRLPARKANRFIARYNPIQVHECLTGVDRMFLSPHVCQPDGIGLGFRVGPGDGLDLQADSLHKRLQKQHGYITR